MILEKDGIQIEILVAVDIARLKAAGYKEVKPEEVKPEEVKQPEDFAAEQQKIAEEALGTGSLPLEKMTVDQLKALAEEAKVEGFETMKKAELIAALRGEK